MNTKTSTSSDTLSLAQTFQKYFSVVLADTEELKQKVYHVRYNVYCKEFEYESAESCPNEIETDEYDEDSLHCLIIHKKTNIPAACVRLVPTSAHGHDVLLPFEKYCGDQYICTATMCPIAVKVSK